MKTNSTTLPDDVVERVARALDPDAWRIADEAGGYDKARGIRRALDYSLRQARAALEAARYGELIRLITEMADTLKLSRLSAVAANNEARAYELNDLEREARALLSTIGAA